MSTCQRLPSTRGMLTHAPACAHACASAVACCLSTGPPCPPPCPPDADGQGVKGGWWELVQESWTVVSSQSFIPRAGRTELAENGLPCCPRTAVSLPLHGDHALHHPPRPCPTSAPAGSMDGRPRSRQGGDGRPVGRRGRIREESVQASDSCITSCSGREWALEALRLTRGFVIT